MTDETENCVEPLNYNSEGSTLFFELFSIKIQRALVEFINLTQTSWNHSTTNTKDSVLLCVENMILKPF